MSERTPSPDSGQQEVQKLETFIKAIAERYRTEGIPMGDDGRIDAMAYQEIYPDVAVDLRRNQEWEEKWHEENGQAAWENERRQTDGEKLEMLAHGIFSKNLNSRFVVIRASAHDDRVNKVDTILLDRETGELVCAFDEVGDTSGMRYEKKQSLIQERNLKGGASLKYGLAIETIEGKKKVKPAANHNIPIFYIALPKDRIEKGTKEFMPDIEQQSDFEQKLFSYFIATLTAQIQGLELYGGRLDERLKQKLANFKKTVYNLNVLQNKKK